MRVRVYPADQGGCGHYRMIWPGQVLAAQGNDVTVSEYGSLRCGYDRHPGDPTARVVVVDNPDCDVAVFQRPTKRHLVEAIEALQRQGVAVVVEVDDLVESTSSFNPWFRELHPSGDADHNWRWVSKSCAIADMVIVSTQRLAERYGAHGRVVVIPNCVPARYFDIMAERKPVRIGYAGFADRRGGDLAVIGSALSQVCVEPRVRLIGFGNPTHLHDAPCEAWALAPITEYPSVVAKLDIGIAPLADTAFNAAKSWLKALEYASLGVACVATPSVEYVRAEREGLCVLADRPRTWLRELRRLLNDDLRAERVERGRLAARNWIIENHADRWWDAWCSARNLAAAV